MFNIFGFICYAIYASTFFFYEPIRQLYRDRNHDKDNLVVLNDVVFVYNVLVLSIFILGQSIVYGEWKNQQVSRFTWLVVGGCTLGCLIMLSIIVLIDDTIIGWLDVLYYLSFVKLAATLFKCCPQVYLNYKNKSTAAWSAWNVYLDLAGSIASFVQIFIDAYRTDNWAGIWGNPIKPGLGLFSLTLDAMFMVQHHILYRGRAFPGYAAVTDEEVVADFNVDIADEHQAIFLHKD